MTIEELENWPRVEDGWEQKHNEIPDFQPEGCDPFKQTYRSSYMN